MLKHHDQLVFFQGVRHHGRPQTSCGFRCACKACKHLSIAMAEACPPERNPSWATSILSFQLVIGHVLSFCQLRSWCFQPVQSDWMFRRVPLPRLGSPQRFGPVSSSMRCCLQIDLGQQGMQGAGDVAHHQLTEDSDEALDSPWIHEPERPG